jgi:hypothetical protein
MGCTRGPLCGNAVAPMRVCPWAPMPLLSTLYYTMGWGGGRGEGAAATLQSPLGGPHPAVQGFFARGAAKPSIALAR